MKIRQWPNRLGHDVTTRHGIAEVFDVVDRLKVIVPITPAVRVLTRTVGSRVHYVGEKVEVKDMRYRVGFVPLGTDPADAVARTLKSGAIYDSHHNHGQPFEGPDV